MSSRFSDDGGYNDGPYVTWEMIQHNVGRSLGSASGQQQLAALEAALLALPQPRLVRGHLAAAGDVCTVGALVAHRRAQQAGCPVQQAIAELAAQVPCVCGHTYVRHAAGGGACTATVHAFGRPAAEDRPCSCTAYSAADDEDGEGVYYTVGAGVRDGGLNRSVAEHLAYLNDELYAQATPEARHALVLAWVRRALGREAAA